MANFAPAAQPRKTVVNQDTLQRARGSRQIRALLAAEADDFVRTAAGTRTRFGTLSVVIGKSLAALTLAIAVVGLASCRDPSPDVTVTNRTNETIRLTGTCVADDPHTLAPGTTDNELYLGAQCRIDDGDGLNGMLGCITLANEHTFVTPTDLRHPPGPDDCWGSGTGSASPTRR